MDIKKCGDKAIGKTMAMGKILCKFYAIMRKKKNSRLLTDIKDQAKGIPIPRFQN